MIDPMPALRAEVAAISGVSSIVSANPSGTGARVRNYEAAPGDVSDPYRAYVLLTPMPWNRHPRLPIFDLTVVVQCYGRTVSEARSLYAALSEGIHGIGPRVNASRIAIYRSHETEAEFSTDPTTSQPYIEATISATVAAVAVPA